MGTKNPQVSSTSRRIQLEGSGEMLWASASFTSTCSGDIHWSVPTIVPLCGLRLPHSAKDTEHQRKLMSWGFACNPCCDPRRGHCTLACSRMRAGDTFLDAKGAATYIWRSAVLHRTALLLHWPYAWYILFQTSGSVGACGR